jgi:DNA-directed RNA polymerase II subunit RPB1
MPLYNNLAYNLEQDLDIESIKGIQFSVLSPDDIRKRSVCEITKTDTYTGNEPVVNGLFDIRMGALELNRLCATCNQKASTCPNHMGHINLEVPLYHAMFFDTVRKILKCVCFRCSKLHVSPNTNNPEYMEEMRKIQNIKNNHKRFESYVKFVGNIASKKKMDSGCGFDGSVGCGNYLPSNVRKETMKLVMELADPTNLDENGKPVIEKIDIMADDALRVLKRISDADMEILGFNPQWNRPEWLILTVFPVPPPAVRPSIIEENGQRREDDLTHKLSDIVKHNNMYRDKKKNGASMDSLSKIAYGLQYHVFTFLDNSIPGISPSLQRNGRKLKSVSDRMKKKEGRIRGNLNAKRVDQSARSVITPDPYISIDQLGVPIKVAMNLTFPEVVNKYNIDNMRQLVMNGPDKWPGAKYVRKAGINSSTLNIKYADNTDYNRVVIANNLKYGDVVHRHLQDNDYVLFNRQPSLHKMSMMCHKAKVMPYKTFRLNVLDTPPYNADFDGDKPSCPKQVATI